MSNRPGEEEGWNLRRPVGYRAVWQSTSDGYVWDGASSRVVPTMRQAQEIIEQWNAMGLVSDALECRVQTLYEDATAAPGAAAAAPTQDAEDAAKWREHVGKLDALVAYCPTCCEGKVATADMTRDEVIFQCGRTSGKSEAARAAQAQGGA